MDCADESCGETGGNAKTERRDVRGAWSAGVCCPRGSGRFGEESGEEAAEGQQQQEVRNLKVPPDAEVNCRAFLLSIVIGLFIFNVNAKNVKNEIVF